MRTEYPYHEGELLAQQRVGVLEEGRRIGQAISESIVTGALKFINQQPMAVLGSLDKELNVWASVLVGQPGFMTAGDARSIDFDLARMVKNAEDPFWANVEDRPEVGMLVIELATRRRLRVNGRVTRRASGKLRLDVEASYPNCPKYIQRRLIRGADTLFVASAHLTRGVDASHRGGNPGFIRVLSDRKIRIPDYVGNNMFNTLGNFAVNPRAGLSFLDFEHHRVLQLSGRSELLWHLDEPVEETGGTQRYWTFEIARWIESDLPMMYRWELLDYSPFNPGAGKK